MYGINKKVLYKHFEHDSFYGSKLVSEEEITCRVQKQSLRTRTVSNAISLGTSTTYFITMDFLDYKKGDILEYNNRIYEIEGVHYQDNIYGSGFLYIRLDTVVND